MSWRTRLTALRMPGAAALLCGVLLCLELFGPGCAGYRLGTGPSVLPERFKTMAVKRVENPTLETWIEDELRAQVRDEFTRRRLVQWAHADAADTLLFLKIIEYSRPSSVRNSLDTTLKYTIRLTLEAQVKARENNEPVWRSGHISVNESFFPGEEKAARELALAMAARRIADMMVHAY